MVTPQGFPLAYETMPGNTSEKSTLADFLAAIESRHGRSERVWIMDRGIPTEEALEAMREGEAPVIKERSMRRWRLKKLWRRLGELRGQAPARDELLMKLGATRKEAGRAWHLVEVCKPAVGEEVSAETFALQRRTLPDALQPDRRRPRNAVALHMRLTEVEQAFKESRNSSATWRCAPCSTASTSA